jgi:hypothetical protein
MRVRWPAKTALEAACTLPWDQGILIVVTGVFYYLGKEDNQGDQAVLPNRQGPSGQTA